MVWICKNCETKNEGYQNACYICGALRHETKAVGLDKPDDPYGSDQNRPKDGKKPWLRSPAVITLLALMMFGVLFVGIWVVGRPLDGAGAETLMKPGDTQEQRNSEQGEIMWHDAFLEDGIRKALGKGEGESVTLADTAGIYSLSIVGDTFVINDAEFGAKVMFANDVYLPDGDTPVEIPERTVSLEDLAYFPNLKALTLVAHRVERIEGLKNCSHMEDLTLYCSGIEDITPLASMHDLRKLYIAVAVLDENDLQTIGRLSNLEFLSLPRCDGVVSIESLGNLSKLQELNLNGSSITDIQVLTNITSLKSLDLGGTYISDVAPLKNLIELNHLVLPQDINDLSSLVNLVNLKSLDGIGYDTCDLTPLKNLVRLQNLDLDGRLGVSDLSPLSNMIDMRTLSLYGTSVSDLSPLRSMKNLEVLDISETQVNNLAALKDLTNLREFIAECDRISDLSPLKKLTNLKVLYISTADISDLSQLSRMVNLETLSLSFCPVNDLFALADLKKLIELDITYTNVTDVSALQGLPLEHISADDQLWQELREMFPNAKID